MDQNPPRNYDDDVDDDMQDDSNYIYFKDRSDWKDVTPVEQDDGPFSAVKISYSPKFKDAYDYLRAVMLKGEKSPRVLELTAQTIEFNAANYTAWQYRRDTLDALGIPQKISNQELKPDFDTEVTFSTELIEDNPKNYQVWHHRKVLVSWAAGYDEVTKKHSIGDPKDVDFLGKRELQLTAALLRKDAKNYHAWQHRQWVVSVFGGYNDELEYTTGLINSDVRNNSAWNHRFFVVRYLYKSCPNLISAEVDFTTVQIRKAISNESPWSYLRGLLELQGTLGEDPALLDQFREFIKNDSPSIPLRAFVLDIYEKKIEEGSLDLDMLKDGLEICSALSSRLDSIRAGYWNLKKKTFELKLASVSQ